MDKKVKLMLGDNIESLKKLPDNSIDSVVSDPPYGLSFMGKKWDYEVPTVEFWSEVYRVLKPGGHILSFGGTRTYHRMVVNIEDAGFEIRDQIMWLYGTGFPKSHNIGKAVDKLQGNEREIVGKLENYQDKRSDKSGNPAMMEIVKPRINIDITKGNSEFEGWGTALKPANEPVCLARKPLSEKSVAENVLKWRTGGLNIDGCRVGNEGRFPANVILECICDEVVKGVHTNPECTCSLMDQQTGILKGDSPNRKPRKGGHREEYVGTENNEVRNQIVSDKIFSDKGGASRFFYQAKVSMKERNMGIPFKNIHPTVKPVNLMAYLCRLITPTNGIVLDPFMGSGSTGIAARLEDFRFVGMEMTQDYFKIAESRIENYEKYKDFLE